MLFDIFIGSINVEMDQRKSAGSDIQRLQEIVKKLENHNVQLKLPLRVDTNDYNRRPVKNLAENRMVKVRLGLDDVPLLDVNGSTHDEGEDSWLYESPVHLPSPAQTDISPYKYLKDSVDVSDLNKVRGSLMAKLESIAAQEEALSRSPPNAAAGHHQLSHPSADKAVQDQVQDPSWLDNSDSDSNEDISVVSHRTPQRRTPLISMSNQGDASLVVKGSLKRRGGNPPAVSRNPSWQLDENDSNDDDDDRVPVQRRPMSRGFVSSGPTQGDEDLVVKGKLRRRGESPQPRSFTAGNPSWQLDENDSNNDDDDRVPVQRRPMSRGFVSSGPTQGDEDLVVKGKLRRRGESPQPRSFTADRSSLAHTFPADYENESKGQTISEYTPRRRVPATSNPQKYDIQNENNVTSLVDGDIPIVTAVRRRSGNRETAVRPSVRASSPKPQPSASTPVKRRELPRARKAEDTDVRRRSLPQSPARNKAVTNQDNPTGRLNPSLMGQSIHSPSSRYSLGRSESPVAPRGGQLAAPRRIPTPRGFSPARSHTDDSWMDGCY